MNKICLVAPYPKLKELAEKVISENNYNISVVLGDLYEGVKQSKKAIKKGCEVIISRGGTATLIRKNVEVPVVEINVTGFDLLRVIYPYRNTEEDKIGIIGYSNVIYGMKAISEIINLKIDYYEINKKSEVLDKVKEAISNNVNTIVGDTIAVKKSKKNGLNTDLITSGKEAITSAILKAQKVYDAILKEREKREKLQTILDFAQEGIMSVNKKGKITVFNPKAEKLFKKKKEKVINKKVENVIPNTRLHKVIKKGKRELDEVQNIGETKIATNRVPILVNNEVKGAVATFQDVTRVQELEQNIRKKLNKKGLTAKYELNDIIGNSKIIKQKKKLAQKYGEVDSTVLIKGESGTGKELFAQGIHNCSFREKNPFVAINCAALPPNLLESELFGYEEGTFTGAQKGGKKGLLELAHKGTIFLDEIGEMDKKIQSRLLRVIQERRIMRLGGREVIPIDVRIIAATNSDLERKVKNDKFRKDLYYRINVLELELPPLKERKEDINLLVNFLLKEKGQKLNKDIKLNDEVLSKLKDYDWPGNVRELENVIEKIAVIAEKKEIKKEEISFILRKLKAKEEIFEKNDNYINVSGTLEEVEEKVIKEMLSTGKNKKLIAKKLGIDRSTLWRKIKKYDLE